MGFVRFVLIGILVFILLRFLTRLIAEVRSFLAGRPTTRPKAQQGEDHRDIRDATFEDVTKQDEKGTPQS
ncbi:MAG: hypothetical protein IH628_09425 [Proteobacteria bacterium]|nr:hypothetical protein [Pseudomonadota bacterium]